jgi:hypothetical protein
MGKEKISAEDVSQLVHRLHQKLSAIDQLAVAVLKSHFLVEEQIDAVLEATAKNPKHLELEKNPRFVQKVKWLRAFAPLGDDERWQLILAINTLRNKVAHKFDGPERKNALMNLRQELGQRIRVHDHAFDEQILQDYDVVLSASMWSINFLARIQQEIEK